MLRHSTGYNDALIDAVVEYGQPLELAPHERIAAAVAIALDRLDKLFELMFCQVFRGSAARHSSAGGESNGAQLFVFQWSA
jgi:hypothetical protein